LSMELVSLGHAPGGCYRAGALFRLMVMRL
jgi:hypothetical protein